MTPTTNSPLNPVPSKPVRLAGEHWYEMTAILPAQESQDFANWLESELAILEESLHHFGSPKASGESLRR